MRGAQARRLRWLSAAFAAAACLSTPGADAAGEADGDSTSVHRGESSEELHEVTEAREDEDASEGPSGMEAVGDEPGEEGEEGEEGEDHFAAARFTCALGVIVVVTSLLIKELQSHRVDFQASRPITYLMVASIIEECVACGAIAMIFNILRKNAVVDAVAVIAQLPCVHVTDVEAVDEAVEVIDALVFWSFFYYIVLVVICVVLVKHSQKSREEEEVLAHSDAPPDTPFQRLRYAFFHPQALGAGVKITSQCTAFDVAHVNFAKYFEHAVASTMREVIHLPKAVILLPLLLFVSVFAFHSLTGTLERRSTWDMHLAMLCSWALLLLAILFRFDVRRMYLQVLPPTLEGTAPFVAAALAEMGRNRREEALRSRGPSTDFDATNSLSLEVTGTQSLPTGLSTPNVSRFVFKSEKSVGSLLLDNPEERPRPSTKKKPVDMKRSAVQMLDKQHELFWFGSRKLGPTIMRVVIQVLLFGIGVEVAVFQRLFSKALLNEHKIFWVSLFLPFPAIIICVCSSLSEFVTVTKLELLTEEELINEVMAETKINRCVPWVGTHTGQRLVQQMKYEAVMEQYRSMTESDIQKFLACPDRAELYNAIPDMEKAMLEAIFNKYDRDGSTSIDRSELRACLEEEGFSSRTADRVAADWMAIYDTDHSGFLSFDEFKMLHTILLQEVKSAQVTPRDCIAMCKRLDKNNNGKMSPQEISEALEEWVGTVIPPHDVKAIFKNICETDDVELDLKQIAEWIYRIYQMTQHIDECQARLMGQAETHSSFINL